MGLQCLQPTSRNLPCNVTSSVAAWAKVRKHTYPRHGLVDPWPWHPVTTDPLWLLELSMAPLRNLSRPHGHVLLQLVLGILEFLKVPSTHLRLSCIYHARLKQEGTLPFRTPGVALPDAPALENSASEGERAPPQAAVLLHTASGCDSLKQSSWAKSEQDTETTYHLPHRPLQGLNNT